MASYSISWNMIVLGNEGTVTHSLTNIQDKVVKHGFDPNLNRCWMELENGAIREVPYWSMCEATISGDARKKQRADSAAAITHPVKLEVIVEDDD